MADTTLFFPDGRAGSYIKHHSGEGDIATGEYLCRVILEIKLMV